MDSVVLLTEGNNPPLLKDSTLLLRVMIPPLKDSAILLRVIVGLLTGQCNITKGNH